MELDSAPDRRARELLHACCGSSGWVEAMLRQRPFGTPAALRSAAQASWWALAPADWKEAFAHHPRIGEPERTHSQGERGSTWSLSEQAGLLDAGGEVRRTLEALNREYESRFGYIYIIRAAGRTPTELVAVLRERLLNDPKTELRIAAAEQLEITLLRLQKLMTGNG